MSIANPGPEPTPRPDEHLADNTPDSARFEGDTSWPSGPGDPVTGATENPDEKVTSPGTPGRHAAVPDEPKGPGPAEVPGD